MKKLQSLLVVFIVLCLSTMSYAKENKLYVGVGFSGAFENFRTELPFDSTDGFNGRIGFYLTDAFSIELEYTHFPGFESNLQGTSEIDIDTYIVAAKYDAYSSDKYALFVTGGFGSMKADADFSEELPSHWRVINGETGDGSYSGTCLKIGFGGNYFLRPNVALRIEMSNVFGMGDVDEFRYNNWLAGVSIYF